MESTNKQFYHVKSFLRTALGTFVACGESITFTICSRILLPSVEILVVCRSLLTIWMGVHVAVCGSAYAPGFGEFTRASAAAKGMFGVIDRSPKIDSLAVTGKTLQDYNPSLRLRSIVFSYPSPPTIKVLDHVSLDFESGKTTALVGASGSGKSTLVGLVERWFDPRSGSISLGGHQIDTRNVGWLRKQIGLVQQEPVLFNDTIYNNMAYDLRGTRLQNLPDDIKRKLVREACIKAYIDDFVQELALEYDTEIGERGGGLIGGQKQGIAIALSIVFNPPILLLDEATSALDPLAEKKVQMALDKAAELRTTILIAHRLSTAQKIVVLQRGKVLEQKTHEELLKLQELYFKLVHAQRLDNNSQGKHDEGRCTTCSNKMLYQTGVSGEAFAICHVRLGRNPRRRCQRRSWHGYGHAWHHSIFPSRIILLGTEPH